MESAQNTTTTAAEQTRKGRKGFTLVELMFVIAIIATMAILAIISFKGGGANDTVRMKTLRDAQTYLEDFRLTYGIYPVASPKGLKYPTSGCAVSGYKSLVDCFASIGTVEKDSDTYKKLRNDPKEGTTNDSNKNFAFMYCVNQNGNKYKLLALAEDQDKPKDYFGVDGREAEKGLRYIQALSPNTKAEDMTTCNE